MPITGLGPSIDPRINAVKTEPQVKIDTAPQLDKGTEILPKEPVKLLASQIEEVKGGIQVNGTKASPGEIQDSGAKLADDCSSSENLKTKFKVENFENHTGIEPHQESTHVNLDKIETHELQTLIESHDNKTENHENIKDGMKMVTIQAGILGGGKELSEHIAEKGSEAIEHGTEVAEHGAKGINALGVITSGAVGIISIAKSVSDIKEIYKISQETKPERIAIREEIKNIKEEIRALPKDSPERAELENKLDGLKEKKHELNGKTTDSWLELGSHLGEATKAGFEFTAAIGGTVGKNIVPGVGMVVAGFEIAVSMSKIGDLREKRDVIKEKIGAQEDKINKLEKDPNSNPDDIKTAKKELEGLNEDLKANKKERRQEWIKAGLSFASGAVGFIPGAGAVIGSGITLVSFALEKHWESNKKE